MAAEDGPGAAQQTRAGGHPWPQPPLPAPHTPSHTPTDIPAPRALHQTQAAAIPTLIRPTISARRAATIKTSTPPNHSCVFDRFSPQPRGGALISPAPRPLLTLGKSTGCGTSQGHIYPAFRRPARWNWSGNFGERLSFLIMIWPRWGICARALSRGVPVRE